MTSTRFVLGPIISNRYSIGPSFERASQESATSALLYGAGLKSCEAAANLRLIAAAPALLDAVQMFV
jgi:hypothetical protein